MLGLVIVGAMFSSVVGTIVLPRGVHSRIAYAVWRAIHQPFMAVAGRMRRYESKDRLPGLLGPVSLLALLGAWLLLFLLGYAQPISRHQPDKHQPDPHTITQEALARDLPETALHATSRPNPRQRLSAARLRG